MDLNAIKQRLDNLQSKSTPQQKTDYTTIFWRPSIGKQQVRIVPSAFDSSSPFTELKFYYGITNKVMISPLNFGEKDPISEFAQKLRSGDYDKENYVLAKKIDAKNRIFIPVVVRGEEDKGVRLWQFGKLVYEDLLSMAMDDEIGDYTDIVNGRDFTLETVGPESTGTNYNKTSVRPRMKTSALSDDKTQVETWLETQPNPKDVFKRFTFDEMKDALVKWLSPESSESEGDVVSEPASNFSNDRKDLPWEKEEPKSNFSLDTSNVKESKKDKFDTIFD
tara:strand:+ start:1771 stop:2604 length:834 start_codon:yes stop_codon:yes gene_type:complete